MQRFLKQRNNRLIMQSKCIACGIKKSRFMKKKMKQKGLLSSLGIQTKPNRIPLLGDILLLSIKK